MSKEAYLDMCEMLSTKPKYDEVPFELDDFPDEIQTAIEIYAMLPSKIEGMSGLYLGKDYSMLFSLLDVFEVHNRQYIIRIIVYMDRLETKLVNSKKKS